MKKPCAVSQPLYPRGLRGCGFRVEMIRKMLKGEKKVLLFSENRQRSPRLIFLVWGVWSLKLEGVLRGKRDEAGWSSLVLQA